MQLYMTTIKTIINIKNYLIIEYLNLINVLGTDNRMFRFIVNNEF